jgi:hypothetical protein
VRSIIAVALGCVDVGKAPLDQQERHVEAPKQEGAGEADRPAADDQDRGLGGVVGHQRNPD